MHELAPSGLVPFLEAISSISRAYSPSVFDDDDDPNFLGAITLATKYERATDFVFLADDNRILVFDKVYSVFRKLAANAKIGLYSLNRDAEACIVEPRYWATENGNSDLLHGWYWGGALLTALPVYVEQTIVDRFIPKKTAAPTNRGTLVPAADETLSMDSDTKGLTEQICVYRTGAPGRPSAMAFVLEEFRRRCAAGEAVETVKEEAAALSLWGNKRHPAAVMPSAKTIENKIRDEHRILARGRAPKL